MKRRIKSILIRVACMVVALGVAGLLAEGLVRVFAPQNIVPRYVETAPWGIRKNIGGVSGRMLTSEYEHEFHTNSQGFRGRREYPVQKPPGVFRVIVLGDSVALGHGAGDEETFSAVLEKKLSEARPAEVVNMGVSGFGTAEELIQLKAVGFEYSPDLVILCYFTNDPYNNSVSKLYTLEGGELRRNEDAFVPAISIRDSLNRIPGYPFLSQHSHLVNLVRGKASGFFIGKLGREAGVTDTTGGEVPDHARELTRALLAEVAAECRQRNVPLLILDMPLYLDKQPLQNLPMNAATCPPGVEIVNVVDAIYAGHPVESLAFPTDCHPTPFAHRLIGEWLAMRLAAAR
jgi:hypothetical protein